MEQYIQSPSLFEAFLQHPGGIVLLLGATLLLLVFLVPLFLSDPIGWQGVERRVAISDWLFSIAFGLLGVGFLLFERDVFKSQMYLPSQYRIGISVLCFAIAGRKTIFAKH